MDQQLLNEVKGEYQSLLDQGRLADALPLIMQAAHWADVDSQILAERILLHGQYGHQINPQAGAEIARLAAMNGDAQSMYDLYLITASQKGADRGDQRAMYWLTRAAKAGLAQAQDTLGLAYLQAKGVERDPLIAREWFEKAIENGMDGSVQKHLQMAQAMIARADTQNNQSA